MQKVVCIVVQAVPLCEWLVTLRQAGESQPRVGISGAVTVGARLDLTACPPGGPSVGCSPPCLKAHRVSSVLRLCAGRLACIGRPCGTCWGWPGACSERELWHPFGFQMMDQGKFLIGQLRNLQGLRGSVHLRPASLSVPRCVSQVMPTVVRIVLNLTFSITGLF